MLDYFFFFFFFEKLIIEKFDSRALILFSGVTIEQHSARQSSTSKITVMQVEVLKATSIDIAGSVRLTVKFHFNRVKNQSASPRRLLALDPVRPINRTNIHTCIPHFLY